LLTNSGFIDALPGFLLPDYGQPVAHRNRPRVAAESGVDLTADSRPRLALSGAKIIRPPCRCPYGFAYGPAYGQVGERQKIATHLSFWVYFCSSFWIRYAARINGSNNLQIVTGHFVA
jgi:hypothetical protein